jgi:hypothetical protein
LETSFSDTGFKTTYLLLTTAIRCCQCKDGKENPVSELYSIIVIVLSMVTVFLPVSGGEGVNGQ